MKRQIALTIVSAFLMLIAVAQNQVSVPVTGAKPATDTTKPVVPKKTTIAEKVKGNKKLEGLFTLYQDTATGSIQIYIKKEQLSKEFIYQSFSINGPVQLFLNQSMHRANAIFKINKAYDKLEFLMVNTSFYYDKKNPISKTENIDKTEAVFYSDRIAVEDSSGYLISGDGLFLSEKLDPVKPVSIPGFGSPLSFSLGNLNPAKSKYANIRSFPDNTDVVVDLSYDNPMAIASGGPDITDPRYVRVRIQHSFIQMPDNDFKPRRDDPRIGYFTKQITDQTSISPVPYRDVIHKWNLKKKDPSAALSEPVDPIVWWVENTTPLEYRQTIVEAGLKWNEAFEKAGFKNVVQMKIMPDTATWDPADIRYNVIRWVSSANPSYGAIGPSFVNPRTGQILGADITVEWFTGSATPILDELFNGSSSLQPNNISTIGIMGPDNIASCTLAKELKAQYITGLTTLEASGASMSEIKEMHKQFLTYLVMHEMGHTMGLNHNMKASQMLSPAEVNNKEITRKIGLMGSVMDYPAINISLDSSKQGDYYTTKAGPYDLWAIEYGYSLFNEGDETASLNKILSKSKDPKLAFGNDGDDMRSPGAPGIDPRVNINDLTNDEIAYAEERFQLVNNIMKKLLLKYSKPGQSYAELRSRYGTLNSQRNSMINAVSCYIGGVYVDRSFPEQNSAFKPYTPVPLAIQKKAIAVLSKYVFAPNAFDADRQVFPYLQMQRRGFNQPSNGEDYKITNNILALQVSGSLGRILSPTTLQRVNNTRLYGNQYSSADIMNDLVKAIFDADINGDVNVYRQYLQSTFVSGLIQLTADKSPVDDISGSAAFYTLRKLKTKLTTAVSNNEETKAHRISLIFQIDKAMAVK